MLWLQGETTTDEIDAGELRAEMLFARLAAVLGPELTPGARLIILFEGPWLSPTGQLQLPHNDLAGVSTSFAFLDPIEAT